MDALWTTLITAIIVAVMGFVIGYIKRTDLDIKFEDTFQKYELFFTASGLIIKTIDPKLYTEMEQLIQEMKTAYESPSFTADAFNAIVKEGDDVFKRAKEIIKGDRSE